MTNLKFKIQNSKLFTKLKNDSHFTELLKGSGIAFILRIVGLGFGYIFTLLVTRTLGAKAWGIFALCIVVLQISSVIGRLGMDTALLRFTAEFVAKNDFLGLKNIYKKMMTLVIPFSIILSILVFYLSPIISEKVFHKPFLTNYFKIVSCSIFPFVVLWVHTEGIRGFKKIKEYMLLQQSGIFIIATIFLGILLLINYQLTLTNYKLIITNNQLINFIPLFCYLTAIIILSILSFIIYKKYLSHNPKFKIQNPKLSFEGSNPKSKIQNSKLFVDESSKFKIYNYKDILSVSIPMLFSSSLGLIMAWTDTIMLGMFRSSQEVGIYNVALRLSMITSLSLMAINTIAAPKFAEFWGKGDIKGLEKVAQQSTKLIFWTSFPILLIFFIFPKSILGIFGKEFQVGAIALAILTIGQFVNAVCGSVNWILNMSNNQSLVNFNISTGFLLNIILNYYLIPLFRINGAAIASMVSLIYWNFIGLLWIRKRLGFSTFYLPKF